MLDFEGNEHNYGGGHIQGCPCNACTTRRQLVVNKQHQYLTEADTKTIQLAKQAGYSHKKIAQMLGTTKEAVKAHLN